MLKSMLLRCLVLVFAVAALPARAGIDDLAILCYHEVASKDEAVSPEFAISPVNLLRQIEWLEARGHHFVSLQQVIDARAGRARLPSRPVLLSFDDGYASIHRNAWPVLKLYRIPAVVAVVGQWLESEGSVDVDGQRLSRDLFMSWAQLREMKDSGLVEIASHTHDLHRGIIGNPQGNLQPAATTRRFLGESLGYEREPDYRERVLADLRRNSRLIRFNLGDAPRAVVWPYGSHNTAGHELAREAGLSVGLTLDDGGNDDSVPLHSLRRILVDAGTTLKDLERELRVREQGLSDNQRAVKVMHVDLDRLHDADPDQQRRNIELLIRRIRAMQVNTIYLQAYSDPDGNGSADALYFPNRHLPMRADLFNHVSWLILKRTQAKRVYAWMPMMAFELPAGHPLAGTLVETEQVDSSHLNMGYHRLTPFSPAVRDLVAEIYQDLARSSHFAGLLFHDDVTLSDYEDASAIAAGVHKSWGLPYTLPEIRANEDWLLHWTHMKTRFLDSFAQRLADVVRQEIPDLRTARNLYAQVALNPYSSTWYAQSLTASVAHYDFTAIMAMPYMEQATDHAAFYRDMVQQVKSVPGAMDKVVFELQATDWRNGQRIPSEEMAQTINSLYDMGVRHVGYYPDNLFQDHPDAAILSRAFARRSSEPEPAP